MDVAGASDPWVGQWEPASPGGLSVQSQAARAPSRHAARCGWFLLVEPGLEGT